MTGYSIARRAVFVSALALGLGIGVAARAAEPPSTTYSGLMGDPTSPLASPEQLRRQAFPWGPYSGPGTIPPNSVYRDGAGFVVDPRNGLPVPDANTQDG